MPLRKRWASGGLLGFSAWAAAACGGLAQESTSTSEQRRRGTGPESSIAPQQPGSRGSANGRGGPPPPVASSPPTVAPPPAPVPTLPPDDPAGVPPIRGPIVPTMSAAPAVPAEPPCQTGFTRCSGSNVEICVATPGAMPEWFISQTCSCDCQSQFGLAFCSDEALCLLPECTPGQRRCTGERLEVCASDGRGWNLIELCGSPCLCQLSAQLLGGCVQARCTAGEAACDEAGRLLTCNECQSGFDVLECGSVVACDAAQQRCLEADAGAPAL